MVINGSTLIAAASGWGAQRHETELGPYAIEDMDLMSTLQKNGQNVHGWQRVPTSHSFQEHSVPLGKATLPLITSHTLAIANTVRTALENKMFPCVIGGDHSIAIGTWQGVCDALDARGNFGLIWLDAHMDAHTPQTSPSHAYHGMPVATLLGYGEESLVHLMDPALPTLKAEHVVLMGVRSYEESEEALLARVGVRIYFMNEIRTRGFDVCLAEAIEKVSQDTKGFGISIDLDGFDPQFAPGVGSPEKDGLVPDEVLTSLPLLKSHPGFCAMEIMEFNPMRDKENHTGKLIEDLALTLVP